ncbi:hypothetical protein OPT61_g3044 [Boeremia exigua]|uniref:Uncharacterized protein n=1 Tax=Boeremia exigua TaxID=749465 RepID=A0ACC2IJ99_9PLEO|nr:hypothetical protein OPT61_g3044 [Boeremia exigua]
MLLKFHSGKLSHVGPGGGVRLTQALSVQSEDVMCFGDSDPLPEGLQTTTRGKFHKTKLKRRRSPAEADQGEPQDPRKLSKLDSTASTLANNQQTSRQGPSSTQEPSKLRSSLANAADNDTDNGSLRIEQLHPQRSTQDCISFSSENTLPTGITKDTPLKYRTAYIEAHNAPEELYSYTFQAFVTLPFYSAVRFELKRSTKMTNSELAVCFDLISTTSQQDYKSSSRGWDPVYKMQEMSDNDMMYLLVRQAEGHIGADRASEHSHHAGVILGFLSFKLEPEDEELKMMRPVQYIYELHLDDRLRGRGLGGRMMKWAEDQARLVKVSKMMLTVFMVNEGARRLYEREGFVKDALSPEDRVTRRKVIKADYVIMSKEI